ncbi:unnamed protein product [Zymoseptoria tritici ST99CH_3D1]|nr:unnamed protein product [Zymoseptoria tritici ST99CH_3D1]
MDWRLTSDSTAGPHVYLTRPRGFNPFPANLPRTLPPPVNEGTFRSPFGINKDLYNFALRPEVPITIALTYIFSVLLFNVINKQRAYKPWAISKEPIFKFSVIIHNALLTVYSAATFVAMCRAYYQVWPDRNDHTGFAGIADGLCKIHGPRGLGDAVTYNTTINIWEVKNEIIKLGYNGNPDPTDVGRLWNEGLAFWGWIFYVSKFYEVLDTVIILAKGKRSATLQTYHHAGAMMCMWAGIRYMSPPISMFVFVNSFIHSLMYTYFTLSALGVRVPGVLKRTLTTMQIAQFVWGASYAAAHLFIKYDVPVETPYQVLSVVKAAASSVSSAASAASSTASKVIESPMASGTLIALAKKLLLRAIGEEGIAERVTTNQGETLSNQIVEKIQQFNERTEPTYETKWRTEITKVNCIDTDGEAFAIYLNLFYLAPLTYLFGRFFVRSYLGWGKPKNVREAAHQTKESGKEAKRKTEEKVEQTGKKAEDKIQNFDGKKYKDQLQKDIQAVKEGTFKGRSGSDLKEDAKDQANKLKNEAANTAQKAKDGAKNAAQKVENEAPNAAQKVKENAQGAAQKVENAAQKLKDESAIESSPSPSPKKKKNKNKNKNGGQGDDSPESSAIIERDNKEDKILAESQAERPGEAVKDQVAGEGGDRWFPQGQDDDTDAMGKSGAIVDFAAAKAEEAKQKAKEVKDGVDEAIEESRENALK